jgi:hypothetical protein
MGIPLVAGRFATARDTAAAPTELVINQAMAQRYWPGESAVNKCVNFDTPPILAQFDDRIKRHVRMPLGAQFLNHLRKPYSLRVACCHVLNIVVPRNERD